MLSKKPILITGASGLVGSYICKFAKNWDYDVIGTYGSTKFEIEGVKSVKMDITNFKNVRAVFKQFKPLLVIHSAALVNADYCEEHPQEAFNINSDATLNIIKECDRINSRLHYLSSMYVFDGTNPPYDENAVPNPINIYGESKLIPEKEVINFGGVVIRASVIYGWNRFGRNNFATWVIHNLRKKVQTKVFVDMVSNPTYASSLAEIILRLHEKNSKGIFHVGGASSVSRYEFAMQISQIFGLDKSFLIPIRSNELTQKANRPTNDSVKLNKIQHELNLKMPLLSESLRHMKKEGET